MHNIYQLGAVALGIGRGIVILYRVRAKVLSPVFIVATKGAF